MENTRRVSDIWTQIMELSEQELKQLEYCMKVERRWREINGEVVLAD